MNKYTIYCTPFQTKKAFNFGAPLEIGEDKGTILCRLQNYHTYKRCVIPTAEQMLGWLRSQGIQFHFDDETNYWSIGDSNDDLTPLRWYGYSDNKELDAIDAALEYLEKKIIKL